MAIDGWHFLAPPNKMFSLKRNSHLKLELNKNSISEIQHLHHVHCARISKIFGNHLRIWCQYSIKWVFGIRRNCSVQAEQIWTSECSNLRVKMIKSMLLVKVNLNYTCIDFYHFLKMQPQLLGKNYLWWKVQF